jgi:hypothetical protein
MGEIAEMMLDGILDCETGEYLGDACGFPRTTADLWRRDEYPSHTGSSKRTIKRREQRKKAKAKAKAEGK